jgi:hypothetical protein
MLSSLSGLNINVVVHLIIQSILVSFFHALLFESEEGISTFPRNVGVPVPSYMALLPHSHTAIGTSVPK